MPRNLVWHGCLYLAIGAFGAAIARGADHIQVRSRVFDIEYSINEDALPLASVQLWYTLDGGANWQEFGFDEDRQSPITFHAPQEGLYGFFLVLANTTGPSSTKPTSTTQPHLGAFVDYTPPVVQLHTLRSTTMLGQRVLQARWTAIDPHFDVRPVELAYQRPPDETWYPVTPDPVANTGRYDWRVPEGLSGRVAVRLTVTDKGGHRIDSEQQVIELAPVQPIERAGDASLGVSATTLASAGRNVALPGLAQSTEKARRLFSEAEVCKQRGEFREGIARLREAVKLNPRWAEAFAEMADMLYRIGDPDRALRAYELALKQQPTMRSALRGAAMVYRQRNDHVAAARMLRTILRYNPNDAEVWMNLGDIAIYQGDEVLARECYTRATQIDPGATRVIADARKRLELMAEVSRRYRPNSR